MCGRSCSYGARFLCVGVIFLLLGIAGIIIGGEDVCGCDQLLVLRWRRSSSSHIYPLIATQFSRRSTAVLIH